MPIELNGKVLAKKTEDELIKRVSIIKDKLGNVPSLATILVGDNPASVTYVSMKAKACERIGLGSKLIKLAENTTTEELLSVIDQLNVDEEICGILLQHPVPKQICL